MGCCCTLAERILSCKWTSSLQFRSTINIGGHSTDLGTKFKTCGFQLVLNDKSVIVLPHSTLKELATIPSTVASPHAGLESDLLGPYTGLDHVLESRLHHSIIQRKLTPRLGLITPGLEKELCGALNDYLPNSEDWIEFEPYHAFAKLSARFSAQAIAGPAFAHNEEWLKLEVEYVESRECINPGLKPRCYG